jgi:imidazolonepropionase-like amidohydrolase
MTTAFVGAAVIDGTDGKAREGLAVVVDGETITGVIDAASVPSDAKTVNVAGRTIMPGVIDTHTHFAAWAQWLISKQEDRLMLLAARTMSGLERTLARGVTTARDMGGLDAGFVQAVEQGVIAGPRLQTAVVILHPTNGLNDSIPGLGGLVSPQGHMLQLPGFPDPHCDGPVEARKKVRETLRAGADLIKIAATSATVGRVADWTVPSFTTEEIEAIVDEAHGVGVAVHSHAMGPVGAERSVAAGVDSIEHGSNIDEPTIEAMATSGTWLVPMFWILKFHAEHDPSSDARDAAMELLESTVDTLSRARTAGVRIAMASDAGPEIDPDGSGSFEEIGYMVEAGMTPGEAIVAATRSAAECMRLDREVGTLKAGKYADMLVIDGNPLSDISVLADESRLEMVIKSGAPVGGSRVADIKAALS